MSSDDDGSDVVEEVLDEPPGQGMELRSNKRARIPKTVSCEGSRVDNQNVPENRTLPSELLHSRIKKEKELVKLVKRAVPKVSLTSPVWRYDYFRIAGLVDNWESKNIGMFHSIFVLTNFYCY
jgi:hypothetical protein